MIIQNKTHRGHARIHCLLPDVVCQNDIILPQGRTIRIVLKKVRTNPTRPFDLVPHFNIASNGGLAFPEVLRNYARLFAEVADYMEGVEPLDFQI